MGALHVPGAEGSPRGGRSERRSCREGSFGSSEWRTGFGVPVGSERTALAACRGDMRATWGPRDHSNLKNGYNPHPFRNPREETTTVSHKRRVLSLLAHELSVAELQSLASTLEVRSTQGRSKTALVEALVSSRTAGLPKILGCCSRSLLKEVCTHLNLSDAGKELDVLITRIVDEDDLRGWSVSDLRAFLTNYVRVPDELSKAERTHVERHFD